MTRKSPDKGLLIDRRKFLAASAAVTVGSAFPTASLFAQAATPKRGGTLIVAFPGGIDTLDPHLTLSAPAQQVSLAIYEGLTILDESKLPQPQLATSWEPAEGGKEWVFHLREGVKFHDGSEFTAADVVATIKRSMDNSLGLRSKGAFGPVAEAVEEGKHTVRLKMTQACAETPALVANRWAMITPASNLADIATKPIGTGPFKFQQYDPGNSATLVRNENYWTPELPYVDGLQVVNISQSIAQQAALRGGNVHIVEFLSADNYLVLSKTPGVVAHSIAIGQYHTLMTQSNMAPFDNPKVREAFKYIIDRDALVASALLGQGSVGNDVTLLKGNAYLNELPQNGQDHEKAKALLDEAGVSNLSLELFTSSERPPSPKIAVAFKEGAEKIGINIQIRDVPYTEYVANVARKKALYTSQWNERATLYEALYQIYHSKAPFNYSGVEQAPGMDAKLEELIAELDLEKRKALAGEILTVLHKVGERIIPYFMNYMSVTSDKVKDYEPPRNGTSDLRRVWLADA